MIPLAQLIQGHRKKAGLTQAELAKLAGVGKTVVWDIEHDKESVQWNTLQKIFGVLAITAEWRSPLLDRTASLTSTPAGPAAVASPKHPNSGTSATGSPTPL